MAFLATATLTGKPRVTPIWFIYENGAFYFTTRLRRLKGRHMRRNPHVSLSVASNERPYRAVCAFGKATVLKENRDIWLERLSTRYDEPDVKAYLEWAKPQPDRAVMVLKPDRLLSWDYGRGDDKRQENGESMATQTG